jgi:hypothetical protein
MPGASVVSKAVVIVEEVPAGPVIQENSMIFID